MKYVKLAARLVMIEVHGRTYTAEEQTLLTYFSTRANNEAFETTQAKIETGAPFIALGH